MGSAIWCASVSWCRCKNPLNGFKIQVPNCCLETGWPSHGVLALKIQVGKKTNEKERGLRKKQSAFPSTVKVLGSFTVESLSLRCDCKWHIHPMGIVSLCMVWSTLLWGHLISTGKECLRGTLNEKTFLETFTFTLIIWAWASSKTSSLRSLITMERGIEASEELNNNNNTDLGFRNTSPVLLAEVPHSALNQTLQHLAAGSLFFCCT